MLLFPASGWAKRAPRLRVLVPFSGAVVVSSRMRIRGREVLAVRVAGLPRGASAAVGVSGPRGFSRRLRASELLSGL